VDMVEVRQAVVELTGNGRYPETRCKENILLMTRALKKYYKGDRPSGLLWAKKFRLISSCA